MFSPEASIQGARSSLRNPRRRPRISDGSQQQQQPRRKRNKLGDETFLSVEEDADNANDDESIVMNGSVESSLVMVDIPVREKKGAAKRVFKEDMALYLNKNENYSVKKLPSFPAALADGSTSFRASALPIAGLALALTSDRALVWEYASSTGVPKVLALPLPPALRGADPLPLGQVVRNGPTNDFGVVAVAPSTGRIVFWENIDSAEARSHYPQRRQGIEGTMKLYSGERITQIVDVDHAGYVLVLSSGRLAQLTLRDAQGRPSISTTVLNTPNGSGGSFFSLKGLLGGAIRKTVASVKARMSESKGHMEVIAATRNGRFQLWDLSWSGQQIFKREIDAQENILSIIQQGSPPEMRGQQDVQLLDFAILDRAQDSGSVGLLVLVALAGRDMLDHFLLEVDLLEHGATVTRVVPLRNYHAVEIPKEATGALLLPDPGHTAFVQFPDAIVVASLAQPEESPEAQLFSDAGSSILPFQDCIYFKSDAHVRCVGHALEPSSRKNHTCGALVFVEDYGLIQINAYAPPRAYEYETRSKVTARSKIMQATFFSTVPGTILDFAVKGRYSFSRDDVEKAAIDISVGVLSSTFEHLEGNALVLEDQLRKRAVALRTLNSHLRSQYQDLSFSGRWHLLWHAEKLAAAMHLWTWYQKQLRKQELRPDAYPEKNIMGDIVMALREKFKTPLDANGQKDPIRQFFLKDINSLEVLLPWCWNFFRMFYIQPNSTKDIKAIMQRLHEADEVLLTALETAFSFRKENVERYGLDPDALDDDGILMSGKGYDELPNFWTSTHNVTASLRSIVDAGRKYADECYEQRQEESVAQEVAQHNPRLVRMSCQTHIERYRWALDQSDEKRKQMGKTLEEEWHINVRPKQIYHLAGIGLASEGMNIAEHYGDMPTLVDLIWEESTYLEEAQAESQGKMMQTEINLKLDRITKRVAHCFERYGEIFANAYFSKYIAMDKSALLLDRAQKEGAKGYQALLTQFLRGDISLARLAWINDVRGERHYGQAAFDLHTAAKKQETNAWCHTVELSIAKLAMAAQDETDAEVQEPTDERQGASARKNKYSKDINARLEVARIQKQLYERLLPTITTAMDDESAVQLLMAEYGQGRLVERPSLQSLLRQGFEQLIHHRVVDPALLIDVLTLMAYDGAENAASDEAWNPFVVALKVLGVYWHNFQRATAKGLVGLIWKRLLLLDDWAKINSTHSISDEAMTDYLSHTTTGWTLKLLLGLYLEKGDVFKKVLPPPIDHLFGSGCTDGELCVRFPSEDIRQRLIEENLFDEAIIKNLFDNHRLADWFQACCTAGHVAHKAEQQARVANDAGEDYDAMEDEAAALPDEESISESVEPVVGETVAGTEEQPALGVNRDVEMQGM